MSDQSILGSTHRSTFLVGKMSESKPRTNQSNQKNNLDSQKSPTQQSLIHKSYLNRQQSYSYSGASPKESNVLGDLDVSPNKTKNNNYKSVPPDELDKWNEETSKKRSRTSSKLPSRSHKQTKLDNYWLSAPVQTALRAWTTIASAKKQHLKKNPQSLHQFMWTKSIMSNL